MFARTRRLTLRPGWPEDAPALTRAIGHESVVMKLSQAPWPYGEDDARTFLTCNRSHGDLPLLITAFEDGEPRVVGCVGIHPEDDGHKFGYWLTPGAWGRGYATEAGHQMVEIARSALGLRRLASGYYVDNPASGRVLAKLGFTPTGHIVPQHCRARGHAVECVRLELDLTATRAVPLAA